MWAGEIGSDRFFSSRVSAMAYGFTLFLTLIATPVFVGQCLYISLKGFRIREKNQSENECSLRSGLIISLVLACGAAGLSSLGMLFSAPVISWFFPSGLLLSCGWLATTAISIGHYGKRGLWLLTGAPLALFWPVCMGALFAACSIARDCL
jgi:hypothetical protein